MKTKLQLAFVIATFFAFQMSGQNTTTISATNSDISDNLDLTAVSSIFGESENLNDFERRLNDPKLQISNLDLNNDNRVDYLRVIESVENSTHVIIIQSIIGRDLYQDVATIEVEKDRSNKVSIQIVGNAFIYGQNYIYEPRYYSTPQIYASFWASYYRPYYSTWTWNLYPTFYIAWNPYPIYRYRQNVYGCVNYRNTYTYVNYRKCYRAPAIYNSYSCNTYERRHPEYAFSRRNSNYTNRYELNQRRDNNSNEYKGKVSYNNSRNSTNYNKDTREYTQNRTSSTRVNSPKIEYNNDYNQNRTNNQRTSSDQRVANTSVIEYKQQNQNRTSSPREVNTKRTESQREYSPNRTSNSKENYSQNTARSSRENNSQREYTQNRTSSSRENSSQKSESQRNNDYASRSGNRRI